MPKKYAPFILIFTGILILVYSFSLGKLSRINQKRISSQSKVWNILVPVRPDNLNPQKVPDSIQKALLYPIYSHLVKVDDSFGIKPDLLKSWEFDTDKKIYRLHLRDEVRFSNGEKINAKDIAFSFHQWVDKDALDSSVLTQILGAKEYREEKNPFINGIRIVDNRTLDIELIHSYDQFMMNLSLPRFCIYPHNFSDMAKEAYFSYPVSSGPYAVVETKKGEIKLSRNQYYYGDAPKIKTIVISQQAKSVAIEKYKLGEVADLIFYSIDDFSEIEKLDHFAYQEIAEYSTETIIINSDHFDELKNVEYRKYLLSNIPIHKIREVCYGNQNVASSIIPKGLIGSSQSYKEDIQTVVKNKKFNNLVFHIADDQQVDCILDIVRKPLLEIGVETVVLPFSEIFKLYENQKLPVWIEKLYFKNEDPMSALQYFYKDSNEYLIGGKHDDLDTYFENLKKSNTIEEKFRLYSSIDHYLIKKSLAYPIVHNQSKIVTSKNLKNIKFIGIKGYLAEWESVYFNE